MKYTELKKKRPGTLNITIQVKPHSEEPDILTARYEVDLERLLKTVRVEPEILCVYGSVLNNSYRIPNDVDVLVLWEGEDIVFPRKTIEPETRRLKGFYGIYDVKVPSAVKAEVPVRKDRGFVEWFFGFNKHYYKETGVPLHIDYRTIDQFITGYEQDEISESVIRQGVPILGEDRFLELTKGIDRQVSHRREWSKDLEGKINCELSPEP